MKTLTLGASKVLQEYMPDETEYMYEIHFHNGKEYFDLVQYNDEYFDEFDDFKTLSLSEALDLLPITLVTDMGFHYSYKITRTPTWILGGNYYISYECDKKYPVYDTVKGSELIYAVEEMLLYLHKEGHLKKQNDTNN